MSIRLGAGRCISGQDAHIRQACGCLEQGAPPAAALMWPRGSPCAQRIIWQALLKGHHLASKLPHSRCMHHT